MQMTKKRSFYAESSPSAAYYKVDWVWNGDSNVNVSNSQQWFTSFTPAQSWMQSADGSVHPVQGIGSVKLRLRMDKHDPSRVSTIVLNEVLYVPSLPCNIIGPPLLQDYVVSLGWPYCIMTKEGEHLGIFNEDPKLHLWLDGREIGQSSLKELGGYVIVGARWADEERARWEEYKGQTMEIEPQQIAMR
jgi:hypothetical protein